MWAELIDWEALATKQVCIQHQFFPMGIQLVYESSIPMDGDRV